MTKEDYFEARNKIRQDISELDVALSDLRAFYIDSNKPCQLNDTVNIVSAGGRTIIGKALGFSLNSSGVVFVDKVKPEKGPIIYLSIAPKSTAVIN